MSAKISLKSGGPTVPTAKRSFISVVSETCQPSPISPRRCESGMRTLVKKTSLKLEEPEIWRIGLTSTPGLFMSSQKKVRPLCLASVGSWRVTRMP